RVPENRVHAVRRGGRPRAARTAAIALTAAAVGLGIARRSRPRYPIRGAVALVTGGSRGLGFLIARELLDQGCAVAICARDAATLDRARRRLAAETNGGIEAFECDVADAGDAADLIARVVRSFGRLDVLVNNAAIIQVAPVQALRAQDFRRVIDIGLMGTVHTTLAALPHLVRARGRIANITSIGGMVA